MNEARPPGIPLGLAELDSDHRYTLGVPQTRTEQWIERRACELGVAIRRGHEVTGLEQDEGGVAVGVRGPSTGCRPHPRAASIPPSCRSVLPRREWAW